MAEIFANYEAVALSGTQTHSTGKETGLISASTIHEVFCISAGTITITPVKGPSFAWPATGGQSMRVMVWRTVVNSGGFIAFRSKYVPAQWRAPGWEVSTSP